MPRSRAEPISVCSRFSRQTRSNERNESPRLQPFGERSMNAYKLMAIACAHLLFCHFFAGCLHSACVALRVSIDSEGERAERRERGEECLLLFGSYAATESSRIDASFHSFSRIECTNCLCVFMTIYCCSKLVKAVMLHPVEPKHEQQKHESRYDEPKEPVERRHATTSQTAYISV